MSFKNIHLLTFVSLFGFACSGPQLEKMAKTDEKTEPETTVTSAGFQLLDNNCYSCHNPNEKIAPSLSVIKKAYLLKGETLAQFTADFKLFLTEPSEATSKMPVAVKQYGLMPKMSLTSDKINEIALFIYNTDLENSNWYAEEIEKSKKNGNSNQFSSGLEMGQELAMKTKGVLGKNLLQAIKMGGTENALSFCSTNAMHLTDSMSVELNTSIKRVSDKNRNPKNSANLAELNIISEMKKQLEAGGNPTPQLVKQGSKSIGYYPILTDKMCLQCHGIPKTEVLPKTIVAINKFYPTDKATGFSLNELRGIWVVEMDK